jgi:glycosyltransferase involved in cell wall biosynthesis
MNAFTGGCHYDNGCGKFVNDCGACPQLGSDQQRDLSNRICRRKRKIFKKVDSKELYIVTPSHWLGEQVKRSSALGHFPVFKIPNGVDTEEFKPQDRLTARQALKISQDDQVLLLVAQSFQYKRKGLNLLIKAVNKLNNPKLKLVLLGGNIDPLDTSIPHIHLGFIENSQLLSLVYSAADLFVIPSIQDNLPNTVLESLSCGTPVVGFNVGGIPDMVRPEVTGILSPPQDVSGLKSAIAQLLDDPLRRKMMADNCRRIAVEEYSLEIQAHRYIELYKKILNEHKRQIKLCLDK